MIQNATPEVPELRVTLETDPVQAARRRLMMERLARNSDWLRAHAAEVYAAHRGKYIAIAGQELFVAENVTEAMTMARAAHPEDDGILTQYIPRRLGVRIYPHRRLLVGP